MLQTITNGPKLFINNLLQNTLLTNLSILLLLLNNSSGLNHLSISSTSPLSVPSIPISIINIISHHFHQSHFLLIILKMTLLYSLQILTIIINFSLNLIASKLPCIDPFSILSQATKSNQQSIPSSIVLFDIEDDLTLLHLVKIK